MISRREDFEFSLQHDRGIAVLTLASPDGMNRLTLRKIRAIRKSISELHNCSPAPALIITGEPNFSAGADLHEIAELSGTEALRFAREGQDLMDAIERYPARVTAAINGFCMGGGLDVALACHWRIAAKNVVFGHRGAALGLITGWGGTQRLPRLIGKVRALQMLAGAEKIHASDALRIGLVDCIADGTELCSAWTDEGIRPHTSTVAQAMRRIRATAKI
jgi:enoyl-CoA hydratase/carnithine racemase